MLLRYSVPRRHAGSAGWRDAIAGGDDDGGKRCYVVRGAGEQDRYGRIELVEENSESRGRGRMRPDGKDDD